ncbi:hypothetical protein HDU79_004061 [Rhizoclosmatium sp. JEL0117]|nr:hypothetical protein HDU79_004061 [Rhizoclosmatium sp. JEL0117]
MLGSPVRPTTRSTTTTTTTVDQKKEAPLSPPPSPSPPHVIQTTTKHESEGEGDDDDEFHSAIDATDLTLPKYEAREGESGENQALVDQEQAENDDDDDDEMDVGDFLDDNWIAQEPSIASCESAASLETVIAAIPRTPVPVAVEKVDVGKYIPFAISNPSTNSSPISTSSDHNVERVNVHHYVSQMLHLDINSRLRVHAGLMGHDHHLTEVEESIADHIQATKEDIIQQFSHAGMAVNEAMTKSFNSLKTLASKCYPLIMEILDENPAMKVFVFLAFGLSAIPVSIFAASLFFGTVVSWIIASMLYSLVQKDVVLTLQEKVGTLAKQVAPTPMTTEKKED